MRAALSPLWGSGYTFITYYPAILVIAALGGWRFGLIGTFASALLSYVIFLPLHQLTIGQVIALGFFAVSNVVLVLFTHRILRGRAEVVQRAIELIARNDEQKAVEAALRKSDIETKLARDYAEATLRIAPLPLIVLRADLRVNTANEAFYKNFQVVPADTEGQLIYNLGNGQWNIPGLRELLEDILPKNNSFSSYEVTHDFETLGLRTMLLNARRLNNEDGQPVQIVLAIEDITERTQSENQLRAAHDSFSHLVQNSPFGIYAVDADFRLVLVSVGAQKVFENVRPLIGRDFAEVLRIVWPEPYATQVTMIFHRVLEGGETYHAPSTIEKRGDIAEEQSYDWKVERITMPNGRLGVVCHFYDLSERMRLEARLRESEEHFRALVNASSDVVFHMNADWSEMGQLDGRNFINDTEGPSRTWFTDNIHPDDQLQVMAVINEAIHTKSKFELEHRILRVDGVFGWTFSRAIPILSAEGDIIEWFGTASDITQRKELEQQKEEFIGIASHEIRTPITIIKTFAELLQMKLTGNTKKEYAIALNHIITQSDRLTSLVEDLLSFSQMKADKFLLNKEIINFDKLIERTVSTLQEITPHHTFVKEGELIPHIVADASRIEQVLINLLTNAVKYSPDGKKVIVSVVKRRGEAIVSVQDFGLGIEKSDHEIIFERFYRGKEKSGFHKSEKAEGFGLGLFIAAQIINKHDGKMWVESIPKKGSTFYFSLPVE